MALDINGRIGYDFGGAVPFFGLSAVVFLTDESFVGEGDNQFGIDLGVVIDLSRKAVFEVALHLNLDDPFDSFDDGGLFGIYASAVFEL
jgi:hypothetical protein